MSLAKYQRPNGWNSMHQDFKLGERDFRYTCGHNGSIDYLSLRRPAEEIWAGCTKDPNQDRLDNAPENEYEAHMHQITYASKTG